MNIQIISEGLKLMAALSGQPDMNIEAKVQEALNDTTKQEQVVQVKPASFDVERHFYTGDVKDGQEAGKTRLNAFYTLPGDINGYSFIEFENGDHFNRNILSKHIYSGVKARMDIKNGSHFKTNAGIGLRYDLSADYDNLNISGGVKLLPVWFNNEGHIENLGTVTVSAGTKLKLSDEVAAKLSAFGEINYNAKGGPEWCYGEWKASVESGKFDVGVGGNLFKKKPNSIIPQNQFKINVTYRF
ncbi:MAG: hypothetical protein KJ583_07600 [Nanoarchaeota archaeon]|nr:hypothetical protein [Nanoarchaeota archaeon]MBU1269844.1 hypothetical protein [Nanoarchaeota archaeon]MBU1605152.1 hypothetical protein [Nanoarchaeota archaeon]MBU2442967.1 hypothetical protein [Nanoarchaeota archaeon]